MQFALDNVDSPGVYTTEEGFQHDNSYFQHGQQLYSGGYGDAMLKAVTQVGSYTYGTRFALNPEQVALLSSFIRDTYLRTLRGKYMLFGVLGRGVSRPDITDKEIATYYLEQMMKLDPAHTAEYEAGLARLREEVTPD